MTSKNDSSSPDHSEYDPLEAFQSLTPAGCKSPTSFKATPTISPKGFVL